MLSHGDHGEPLAPGVTALLPALVAATAAITAESDEAQIGQLIVSRTAELLGAGDVRLALLDYDPDWLVLRHAIGHRAQHVGARTPSSAGVLGATVRDGAVFHVTDFTQHPLAATEPDSTDLGPMMVAPLRYKGETLGAISAARALGEAPFSATDEMALQILTDLVAARLGSTLQASALRARARDLAVLDPLYRPPPDQAGDFVLLTKNRRNVVDADDAAVRILGYPREALLSRLLSEVIPMPPWADQVDNLAGIRRDLLAGKAFTFDTVVRRHDRSLIPVRLELRNYPVADGFIGRGVFHNLRAEEQAQARTLQAEKQRMLAEIGSGLAHALNSPLAIILGNTEMLLSETQDPDVHALLEPARDAAERIAQSVQDLQRFARPPVATAWSEVDLGQFVREAVERTRPLWEAGPQAEGRSISLRLEALPAPSVRVHVAELQEALRELIANAVQALPNGGTIFVRTEYHEGHALITVADDGEGMSEHVRQFCMEPFFTTHRPMANGLGLNRVEHAVQRHRGQVEIVSTEGEGTRVALRLPLLSQD
jgi:signal transduction histidine kinase